MAVTKLVERCFISDLALVSSPEVTCGFTYDSNHRVPSKISQELVATIREYWMPLTCKHWGSYIGEIGTKMRRKEEKMK